MKSTTTQQKIDADEKNTSSSNHDDPSNTDRDGDDDDNQKIGRTTTATGRSIDPPNPSRSRIIDQVNSIVNLNLTQLLLGLFIGLCLALTIDLISTRAISSSSSSSSPGAKVRLFLNKLIHRSSSKFHDSEDHRSWLSWHRIQFNNPFVPNHEPSHHHHPEQDSTANQPPTLKEEIKKIINSNRLKLNNFKIVHSSDEL